MTARVRRGWRHAGFEAVVVENASLRVTVLPELGGKIFELIDKAADRDVLWHNDRTPPRRAPYGAHFDDPYRRCSLVPTCLRNRPERSSAICRSTRDAKTRPSVAELVVADDGLVRAAEAPEPYCPA
ncbi:MAG TPA: DUF5107 domain-containing protein [Candidatus Limnocylindrales bacterium]